MKTSSVSHRRSHERQLGVTSLTVVMLLFFVMALAAAYAGRSMVFEQRTSTNQVRSGQAIEAAQAGLEWAIAMLNSGRITDACNASTSNTDGSFRQRYLEVNSTTAMVTARLRSDGTALLPSCVANGVGWNCSCPADGAPTLSVGSSPGVTPAFRVRFTTFAARPWTTQIEVNGCTRLDNACLNFPASAVGQEGRATITALVTLRTGLSTIPGAAVTSRGEVNGDIIVYNTDASVNGITVQSGGDVNVDESRLRSLPGTPGRQSRFANDASFASAALPGSPKSIGERFFASFFGMWPSTYREQPSVVTMDCSAGCNDAALRTVIANNPARIVWISGDLSVDTSADIGSASEPVMLVFTTGSLTFTAAANIYGVVYVGQSTLPSPPDFELRGPGTIRGALLSEHELDVDDDTTVVYNKAINTAIRFTRGSFVMVPGSWKDF